MTVAADDLVMTNGWRLLVEGDKLLSKAKELSQSLAGPSIDVVEMPEVRLKRGQDWSLEGAVDLQLRTIPSNIQVCTRV